MQHPRYFENCLDDTTAAEEVSTAQKENVPELLQRIRKNCPPVVENCRGAMYLGAAGIGYAFYHVANCPVFAKKRNEYLEIAESYVKVRGLCFKLKPQSFHLEWNYPVMRWETESVQLMSEK